MSRSRAVGLLLALTADRVVPDPRRGHPVAVFGSAAAALERRLWAPSRARGAVHAGVLVGGVGLAGWVAERAVRDRPVLHAGVVALTGWAVLGGASLEREAHAVLALLDADDLPAARRRLTHLVGRDPSALDADEVARAVVESVAENTSDAVVSTLLLGGLAGVPGLLVHRAANTLDAMVGHRSERYEAFGWASARLDDAIALPGARLSAALAVLLGPDPRGAARAWRRDAAAHPSPNAGPVEAAFAGALGVRLGGTNVYGTGPARRVEERAVLGDGRPVRPHDIARATLLARRVDLAAGLLAAAAALALAVDVDVDVRTPSRPAAPAP